MIPAAALTAPGGDSVAVFEGFSTALFQDPEQDDVTAVTSTRSSPAPTELHSSCVRVAFAQLQERRK
jgi:hypothetical protein